MFFFCMQEVDAFVTAEKSSTYRASLMVRTFKDKDRYNFLTLKYSIQFSVNLAVTGAADGVTKPNATIRHPCIAGFCLLGAQEAYKPSRLVCSSTMSAYTCTQRAVSSKPQSTMVSQQRLHLQGVCVASISHSGLKHSRMCSTTRNYRYTALHCSS
jgi:hypothetical protein